MENKSSLDAIIFENDESSDEEDRNSEGNEVSDSESDVELEGEAKEEVHDEVDEVDEEEDQNEEGSEEYNTESSENEQQADENANESVQLIQTPTIRKNHISEDTSHPLGASKSETTKSINSLPRHGSWYMTGLGLFSSIPVTKSTSSVNITRQVISVHETVKSSASSELNSIISVEQNIERVDSNDSFVSAVIKDGATLEHLTISDIQENSDPIHLPKMTFVQQTEKLVEELVQMTAEKDALELATATKLASKQTELENTKIMLLNSEKQLAIANSHNAKLEEKAILLKRQFEADMRALTANSAKKEADLLATLANLQATAKLEVKSRQDIETALKKLKDFNVQTTQQFEDIKLKVSEAHKNELEALQAKLKIATEETEHYKNSLDISQKSVADIQKLLKDSEIQRAQLKNHSSNLEKEKNDLVSANITAQNFLKTNADKEISSLKATIIKLSEKITDLEEREELATANLIEAFSKIAEMSKDLETTEQELKMVKSSLREANCDLIKSRAAVSFLENDVQARAESLEISTNRINSLENEICINSAKLYHVESNFSAESKETVAIQICKLESDLIIQKTEKSRLEKVISELSGELMQQKTLNEEFRETILKAKVERKMRGTRISEVWNELQKARNEIEKKNMVNERLRTEFESCVEELNSVRKNSDSSTELVAAVRTELELKISELLGDFEGEKSAWATERKQLEDTQQEIMQELQDLKTELNSLKAEANSLLSQKDGEIQALREEILSFSTLNDKKTATENQNGNTSDKSLKPLDIGNSLMDEVISELGSISNLGDSKSCFDKIWFEDIHEKKFSIALLEISEALGNQGTATRSENSNNNIKLEVLDGISSLKNRTSQLESLCKELEKFGQETLDVVHVLETNYTNAKIEMERKEQVIKRLHAVLEDGASILGRKRMQAVISETGLYLKRPSRSNSLETENLNQENMEKSRDSIVTLNPTSRSHSVVSALQTQLKPFHKGTDGETNHVERYSNAVVENEKAGHVPSAIQKLQTAIASARLVARIKRK
ncbi:hypothetical protein HK100_009234 [Physocladia obscura]|uniref:Uncharacterized protein n=1 Tax=Physocladia obscura TaxID=109957 RepID=A0AAD5TA06_9FUNG|nr:hypothetical protein HK100_009234 [Physocladia obscura]